LQKFEELYNVLSSENPPEQEVATFHTKVKIMNTFSLSDTEFKAEL